MYLSTVYEWQSYISKIHFTEIELGLDRIRLVAKALGVLKPPCPVIIVGGTNGKGSTVSALESIYRAAEYRVACFTSPYLFRFNEEVRINGKEASDEEFCTAFAAVEAARKDITLTPFEFHTLAALLIMKSHKLDVIILEVGLGGRLDAVNMIDADVAIVTTVSIDHVEYLGNSREKIGFEKAGIFRAGKPAISGDFNPPRSLLNAADASGALFYSQGKDFGFIEQDHSWTFIAEESGFELTHLPLSSIATQNIATALMATLLLQNELPINNEDVVSGIKNIELPGRIEVVKGIVTNIYDVAHNPAACERLAAYLRKTPCGGRTLAVFSMLKDKDIQGCIHVMKDVIDHWDVAPLAVSRGASIERLQEVFGLEKVEMEMALDISLDISLAYQNACRLAIRGDRIVVFGSFVVVAKLSS